MEINLIVSAEVESITLQQLVVNWVPLGLGVEVLVTRRPSHHHLRAKV